MDYIHNNNGLQVKGPYWEVETGRRDGRVSNLTEVIQNLLPPFANVSLLKSGFAQKGLSVKDLAVLSGIPSQLFSVHACFLTIVSARKYFLVTKICYMCKL